MNSSINAYDRIVFLLIVSVVFGYLGSFFTSPIILFTVLFFFRFIRVFLPFFRKNQETVFVFIFLVVYSAVSLFWSPDFRHSLVLWIRAIFHILLCLEIIAFSQKAQKPLESIANAWVFAVFLTACVAIWEMVTDNHLTVIAHQDLEMEIVRYRAAVTFYNNNTYSMFVVFSLPFLLYANQKQKAGLLRLLNTLLLFLLISIVLLNASRGAILGLVIIIAVYTISIVNNGNSKYKRYAIFAILLLSVFMLFASSFLLETILYRTEGRNYFYDSARTVLIQSSWQLFLQSFGMGQGFGSMIPALAQFPGNTTSITYSHNLFLELLLEGGVVFGIPFILLYFNLFKRAYKENDPSRKMFIYSVVLSLPICSIINSSYLSPTFIWVYFVSVYAFSSVKVPALEKV